MTQDDYERFVREYRRLSAALERYKQSPAEASAKADAYFAALKYLPFDDVTAKADRWLQTESKMPKPAEWGGVHITRGADITPLTYAEEREYLRAEALFYEDLPCICRACVESGVSEKPIRFVPEFTPEDTDRQARIGDRIVTRGHWAHGQELARWYQARAVYLEKYYARFPHRPLERKERPRHDRTHGELTKVGA